MPTISRFYGIVIRMYYDDHDPPHFHAYYGENLAVFEIESARLMRGSIPQRASALIREWALMHRHELHADWKLAQAHDKLLPIAPLE